MRNTHPLRKQIDDPSGFWLHCISDLQAPAVQAQKYLLTQGRPPEGIFLRVELSYMIIRGDKGCFLRRGRLSPDGTLVFTQHSHLFRRDLLESFAAMSVMTPEDLINGLILASKWATVLNVQTKNQHTGLLVGETSAQYASLLHSTPSGQLAILDIETRENCHNKANVCALIGTRENVRSWVEEMFRNLVSPPPPAVRAKTGRDKIS